MPTQTSKAPAAKAAGKTAAAKPAKPAKGAKGAKAAAGTPQDATGSAGTPGASADAGTGTGAATGTPAPQKGDINAATGKPWTVKELKAEVAKNAAMIQEANRVAKGGKPAAAPEEPAKPIVLSARPADEITKEWIQKEEGKRWFTVKEGMPVEEWAALVRHMDIAHEDIGFAIGDLLNYGAKQYGKTYDAALAATGRALKTLRNWKSVAASIAPEMRQPEKLTFSIHEAVSSLPAAKQKAILDKAAEKSLTVKEVRALAKKEKPAPAPKAKPTKPTPVAGMVNVERLTAAEEKAWEKMQNTLDACAIYMRGEVWKNKLKKLDRNSVKPSLKILSEAYEALVNE